MRHLKGSKQAPKGKLTGDRAASGSGVLCDGEPGVFSSIGKKYKIM